MVTGDGEAVARVSVGNDASLQVLTASAALNAAYSRLEEAAAKRFGDPRSVMAGGRGADHYANMLPGIDAAPESVQGDQAIVGAGRNKVHLKRTADGWKVDREMQVPPAPGGDMTARLTMIQAMTQAYDEVTNGMASGAYESADAAKAALMGKTMAAVLAQPPATAPATGPIPSPGTSTTRPTTTRPAGTQPVGP